MTTYDLVRLGMTATFLVLAVARFRRYRSNRR